MKKITYQCSMNPDHFTLHALFSCITDNAIKNLNVNPHTKPPHYKIWMEDRCIFIILEESFLKPALLIDYAFNHKGSSIKLKYISCQEVETLGPIRDRVINGDFVIVDGTMNYGISYKVTENGKDKVRNKCPIDFFGNFIQLPGTKSVRQHTFEYLKENTGLNFLVPQIDSQADIRFEPINYKSFKSSLSGVSSKSNQQSLDFHNVFHLHAKAQVVDAYKANSLCTTSIARKRTYGFGNLTILSYI